MEHFSEPLLLLRGDSARSRSQAPGSGSQERSEPRDVFVCRSCEAEVANRDDLLCVDGPSLQVHANPYGIVYEILTLAAARNLALVGEPNGDFTWFRGYSWQIAYCGCCSLHLGWYFVAEELATPASFYGLLRNHLA